MIARKSSSSSLGPFSLSQWLVGSFTLAETEVAECKAFSPCADDDPGIPMCRVSQNPLTPKRTRKQIGAVNGRDLTTVPLRVSFGCLVLTTFGCRDGPAHP